MVRKKNSGASSERNAQLPSSTQAQASTGSPLDWKQDLSELLEWLEDRKWSLSAYTLFLAVICMYNYATQSRVSLSLASVLPVIPAAMALVILVAILMTGLVLMPTVVLFTPPKRGGAPLISAFVQQPYADKVEIKRRLRILLKWMSFVVACTCILLTVIWSMTELALPAWLNAHWIIGLSIMLTVVVLRSLLWIRARASWEFFFVAISTAVLQIILSISVIQIASGIASSSMETENYAHLWLYSLGIVAVVGSIQLIGAALVATAQGHKSPAKFSASICVYVLSVACIAPPVSNVMAAYAVQSVLSGGRGCIVMEWSPDAGTERKLLSDTPESPISLPLRFLWAEDGTYQVRKWTGGEKVFFVPFASRVAIDKCPK